MKLNIEKLNIIFSALKVNIVLTELGVEDNYFHEGLVEAVQELAKVNKTLKVLYFDSYRINPKVGLRLKVIAKVSGYLEIKY